MANAETDLKDLGVRGESDFLPDGWELVCGLEVHTELKTKTKLFCGCANVFGAQANTNVCPTCLGLPGSLPVLNERALEIAAMIGLALSAKVQASIFHRKNYFYPDMPKDFQISQYDIPLNADGYLILPSGKRIGIERAHVEEDTGKITHLGGASGRIHGAERALIDYNRSGVPLVEIVSRPDIASPEEAREYVSELRSTLVAIGASDGKMEEGSLRVDANVSVRPIGETPFRTRCEIKNLNSLRSLVRAITFEAHRQVAAYLAGEKVTQQTRHWDESAGRTVALRNKEEAEDYRYFPEPDLVPLRPSEEWIEGLRSQLGELPKERRARLVESLGLTDTNDQIETAISVELYPFARSALAAGLDPKITVARCANELASLAPLDESFEISWFVELLRMETNGEVSATQAKSILAEVAKNLISPKAAQERLGFSQLTDDQLTKTINEAILQNPKEWERFRTGEAQLQGFFVGKIMKATSGKADGKAVVRILLATAEQR